MFKHLRRFFTASVFCLAVISSTPERSFAKNAEFQLPLAEDSYGIYYTYKPLGEILIIAMIAPVQGKVAVCGSWAVTSRISTYVKEAGLVTKSRATASVFLGGKKLFQGLLFFNKVAEEDLVVGANASCRLTRHAWKSSYSNADLSISGPRLRAHD